jgi:hypothetical protein
MTTDTIAIQKEQPWPAAASDRQPAVPSPARWRTTQYAVLLLGVALLATLLLQPELGLNLMWNGLIPLAPALLVIVPGLWRNICPMATLSLLPQRLGLARRNMLPRRWAAALSLVSLGALFVIVPLRHLTLDTNAPLTALMIALSALLAVGMGMAFELRSGWCNSLCPIHPVEKLYGQAPALTVANARCDECRKCSQPCPDSIRTMNPIVTGSSRLEKAAGHLVVGALVGFIWGWYRVPDFHGAVNAGDIVGAFAWPYVGALCSLALYAAAYRWVYRSDTERRLLVKLFATAAVGTYYWYRIPALTGFGPTPGTGMLLDLSGDLPALPIYSRIVTTSFFVWFLLLRSGNGNSWTKRPVRKLTPVSTYD